MAGKVSMDIIKPFSGEGDIVGWLRKVTLVAKLQKIADLASFIPLYLEGDALALYLELDEKEQADATKIQEKLKVAFSDDPFAAFAKLVTMRWRGESVDVFANEIRRLAGLAKFEGEGLENVVKLTFVNGFPDTISIALQQLPDVEHIEMSKVIDSARILSSKQQGGVMVGVTLGQDRVVNVGPLGGVGGGAIGGVQGERQVQFRGRCFRCNGPHRIRDCKETKVRCFKCNKFGHISSQCKEESQGNE